MNDKRINAIHAALLNTGKVLIIAGSGPTDRDGNSALGVKTDF